MLRSNTKQAINNIREYIMQDADYLVENYGFSPTPAPTPVWKTIYEEATRCDISADEWNFIVDEDRTDEFLAEMYVIFRDEKYHELMQHRYVNEYNIFKSWAQGLALGGLFCYYYNRSAVDDLGDILEETPEERAKYSEQDAEEMLTRLIYREMVKAYSRVSM